MYVLTFDTHAFAFDRSSAFYEMEAEIFVQSESFASDLEEKFTRESDQFCIPVNTVDECNQFLPKGCEICEGFGPFFDV